MMTLPPDGTTTYLQGLRARERRHSNHINADTRAFRCLNHRSRSELLAREDIGELFLGRGAHPAAPHT
jgi:hypothetical protein